MRYCFVILGCLCACSRFQTHVDFPEQLDKIGQIIEVTKGVLLMEKRYTATQMEDAVKQYRCPVYGIDAKDYLCKSSIRCYGEFTVELGVLTISYAAKYERWREVLAHEYIHFFNYTIEGRVDVWHRDERFFEFGCKWRYPPESKELFACQKKSAEGIINERLKLLDLK